MATFMTLIVTSVEQVSAQSSQTITFPMIGNQTFSTNPVTITLPTASSGLPVNITVSGPATLTGNLLTMTGLGTVTLVASQSGTNSSVTNYQVSTFAGNGNSGFQNGKGTFATFNGPHGATVDGAGNVYVADAVNNAIRKIDANGNVTTLAGNGSSGFNNGRGPGATTFNNPSGVAVDGSGNVYVADCFNHVVRKIDPNGNVSTFAGKGPTRSGFQNGQGTNASFNYPKGVAVDGSGNVYVADHNNQAIRKIDPIGNVTTLAGGGSWGFLDGNGTNATFNAPKGVAVDGSGNVYVADYNNQAIRKIDPIGNVTTIAGNSQIGFKNGSGTGATFHYPSGVAVDGSGNVYVLDNDNNAIRKIDPSGNVTTLAGSGSWSFLDGNGTNATFRLWTTDANGVAVEGSGSIYVADNGNNVIRKMMPMYGSKNYAAANSVTNSFEISPRPAIQGLINNATLTNAATIFSWSSGPNVTQYYLQIGSTPGAGDIISKAEGTNTADTITLPTDGRRVYVTLYSLINGLWNPNATTYSMVDGRAQLVSPYRGSPITNSTNAFTWSKGTGVTQYYLQIGSTPGAGDFISRGEGNNTSDTNVYLPTDGRTVYVTLYSQIYGNWVPNTSTFLTVDGRAALLTPTNNATLTNSTNAFTWSKGTGVTQYYLQIGSSAGSGDLISKGEGTNTTDTNVYLPTDGRTVYTTLWSQIYGVWKSNTTTTNTMVNGRAAILTPVNGSTLTNSTNAFTWSAGTGVTQYYLSVGNSAGASDIISRAEGMKTNDTSVALPTDGRTLYATLWSQIYGVWNSTSAVYTALDTKALLISPASGSTLTNTAISFTRSTATNATGYYLTVGSTMDGRDFYNNYFTGTNQLVTNLPADGRRLFVKLYSQVNGAWLYNGYTFNASTNGSNPKSVMVSPASGNTLTNASTTFTWSAGTNISQYFIQVGTSLGAGDLISKSEGTNHSDTLSLPSDGKPLYVTLWSMIGGVWQSNSYLYNAFTSGNAQKALLSSPVNGSIVKGNTLSLNWSAGSAASQYYLQVGSSFGAGDLFGQSLSTNTLSQSLAIPQDGRRLYVTLWSMIGGVWQPFYYYFDTSK